MNGVARSDPSAYTACFAPIASLGVPLRDEMARLYLQNYDASDESRFLGDLANKDEVLILRHEDTLVGFTALRVFERNWQSRRICVVYSGDTIVARSHWGQQAMAFAWIERMGAVKRERADMPMYWFLLVKGHRTFRYLPVFAKSFHPHWQVDRSDLRPLADALAADMFPDAYNPVTGVVEFAASCGHLKPELAAPEPAQLDREDVRFFLARNPGYARGHELVCLCEIEEQNMKPLTLRLFRRGRHGG